jgi:hypothetical protein
LLDELKSAETVGFRKSSQDLNAVSILSSSQYSDSNHPSQTRTQSN